MSVCFFIFYDKTLDKSSKKCGGALVENTREGNRMNKKLSVSAQNKQALLDTIEQMAAKVQNYCKNPEKAFTRTRKIPFDKLILLLLGMTGSPLNEELTKAFKGRLEAPSASAYIQQRQKLLPCTMQKLFESFNKKVAI